MRAVGGPNPRCGRPTGHPKSASCSSPPKPCQNNDGASQLARGQHNILPSFLQGVMLWHSGRVLELASAPQAEEPAPSSASLRVTPPLGTKPYVRCTRATSELRRVGSSLRDRVAPFPARKVRSFRVPRAHLNCSFLIARCPRAAPFALATRKLPASITYTFPRRFTVTTRGAPLHSLSVHSSDPHNPGRATQPFAPGRAPLPWRACTHRTRGCHDSLLRRGHRTTPQRWVAVSRPAHPSALRPATGPWAARNNRTSEASRWSRRRRACSVLT